MFQEKVEYCSACVVGIATATYNAIVQFTEEVRANSEDDDTMVSLEQIAKESSYESIEYHKPHTEIYEEFLKRKRLSRLIKSHASLATTVLSQLPPRKVHAPSSSSGVNHLLPSSDIPDENQKKDSHAPPHHHHHHHHSSTTSTSSSTLAQQQHHHLRHHLPPQTGSTITKRRTSLTSDQHSTSAFDDDDQDDEDDHVDRNRKNANDDNNSNIDNHPPPKESGAGARAVQVSSPHHHQSSSNGNNTDDSENNSSADDLCPNQQNQHDLRKILHVNELGDNLLSDARNNRTVGERLATQMEEQPQVIKWVMHIILALCVGCFVASASTVTAFLESWRLSAVESAVMTVRGRGNSSYLFAMFEGLLVWLASAALLVSVATAVVVFVEPGASGSGLPQVMAYLNGVLIRHVFSLKLFLIKTVSVIGAVSGGLPCGAEAPFVLLGAAIGAGVSSGRSRALGFQTSLLQGLRNSKDRRDFVTAGAACGVAAAFGSPIGGMLFVMEEASVVLDLITSSQIFLGSMTAFTAMAILYSFLSEGHHGFVSRDVSVMFQVQYAGTIPLNITAVVPAVVLGTICGLLTVVFTKVNLYFHKWRARKISSHLGKKLAEPILIVLVFAFLNFVLPLLLPCKDLISHDESARKLNGTQVETAAAWFTENETVLNTFMCNNPKEQYSPLGTLTMGLGKRSIRRLLSRRTIEEFPLYVIVIFFLNYFCFGAYINGSSIASGLIIPFIVMGSAVGRAFGLVLIRLFAQSVVDPTTGAWQAAYFLEDSWMDPGVYALIGAAAFIGGATRMTISIPVIMVELSGELRFLLPIMVGIAVARVVADSLSVPLYHQLLHLGCVPYLPHSPSGVSMELFTLKNLVSKQQKIAYLPSKPTLQQILDVLRETNHHMFPVLEIFAESQLHHPQQQQQQQQQKSIGSALPVPRDCIAAAASSSSSSSVSASGPGGLPRHHRLCGSVSREDLQVMLALPDFDIGPLAMARFNPNKPYNQLRYEDWIEHENSMFFLLSTQEWKQMWNTYVPHISEERGAQVVDLRLILNKSPWTAVANQSLAEAFNNMRTMSIRHLIVVEARKVLGVVTRKDLLPYRLRQLQTKLDNNLLMGVGLETLIPSHQPGMGNEERAHPSHQDELKDQNEVKLSASSSPPSPSPPSSTAGSPRSVIKHGRSLSDEIFGSRE